MKKRTVIQCNLRNLLNLRHVMATKTTCVQSLRCPSHFCCQPMFLLDNPLNLGSVIVGSYLCRSLENEPLLKPALDVLQPQKQQPQAIGQSSSAAAASAANGGGSVASSSSLYPASKAGYDEIAAAAVQAEQAGTFPGDDALVWPSSN
ncbi:unnamed protein product [Absidia cylindrospora]